MASLLHTIDVERLEASRYMSAAGLVILLWDHILTFPDEVQLIWRARLSIAKVLFLLNRYAVPLAMIVLSYEFSGATSYLSLPVSTTFPCKAWFAVSVTIGMLSIATSNFLILLRLWVLWDRRLPLVLATLTFFVVTQLVALSLAGYVTYEMLPTLYIDPALRACIPSSKPKFVLLWSPGIAFELVVFVTAVWNALDRPRPRDVGMARVMYRDGSMYFFGLLVLRLVNMLLCLFAPPSLTFLGVFFIWGVSNITLARLVFNLRRLSGDAGHPNSNAAGTGWADSEVDDVEEEDAKDSEDVDQTELPVLRREYDCAAGAGAGAGAGLGQGGGKSSRTLV